MEQRDHSTMSNGTGELLATIDWPHLNPEPQTFFPIIYCKPEVKKAGGWGGCIRIQISYAIASSKPCDVPRWCRNCGMRNLTSFESLIGTDWLISLLNR